MALAGCIALGLSACGGGGGGGNVKSNPPPPPPPPVVDTSPMVVSSDLAVTSGEAITRPIMLESGAGLDNQGTVGGSAIDVGVEAKAPSIIENHDGGIIRGSETAIRLDHGGEIHNGAGSTIEATGTGGTDCGANVRCAIYVGPNDEAGEFDADVYLMNAGTIIGNVELATGGLNGVELVAGGSIQGGLSIGAEGSYLWLSGDAGTTQQLSEAVTGDIELTGDLVKAGAGPGVLRHHPELHRPRRPGRDATDPG
jgi:hypothetical protein